MMSFGRHKRWLVGLAALIAPLPLPFNEILAWPLLAAYLLAVALFLWQLRRDRERWLPTWAMNLLGFLYLPFFVFDFLVLSGGQVVGPVVHLLLFTTVAKLFSMRRERDKWQTLAAVFFLFLAAMATSVHPAVVLYLGVFLVLFLLLLTRFAFLHILTGFGHRDASPALLPLGRFLTGTTVAVLMLAVPLFAALPRVRAPYIAGRGMTAGGVVSSLGFSEEVTLDTIGLARDNPEVVMRQRYLSPPPKGHEMRFKVGAHDRFDGGVWRRTSDRGGLLSRRPTGGFYLSDASPITFVEVWQQPILGTRLALPVDAVQLDLDSRPLMQTRWGTVSLMAPSQGVLQYRVGLGGDAISLARPPTGPDDPTLDLAGVTPEIAALAASVMGSGPPRQQAAALQQYFYDEFDYTLDFLGRASDTPLEDFLFKYKSGHCEYFATAMVLMLRSQGISARLITGYLGGEYNPLEGYFIVRQLNAHAWVEVYIPGQGWQLFDPTPPSGRPGVGRDGLAAILGQAYDYMMFRWDRYIIAYGLYDQIRFFFQLRDAWSQFWDSLTRPEKPETPPRPDAADAAPAGSSPARTLPTWLPYALTLGGAALLAGLGAAGWFWRRHRLGAAHTYLWLRRRLARAGIPAGDSVAPLALARVTARLVPAAAPAAGHIISLYLRESFRGDALEDGDREALREARAATARALRRAPRQPPRPSPHPVARRRAPTLRSG